MQRGKAVSSINNIRKLNKGIKQDYFLIQYKRKTQNVFKDINIRSETVKLLEETIGSMPFDTSLSDTYIYFFYVSSGKGNKSKNKQVELHQTKMLLHSKGNYEQMEGLSLPKSENLFVNDVSNKKLISKIYKELIKLNAKKQITQLLKWAEDLNKHLSKKDVQNKIPL